MNGGRHRRLRRGLTILVGVAILLAFSQRWLIQGLIIPVRVVDSSMVPALLGTHAVRRCPHCQHAFPVEPHSGASLDQRLTCPGCGQVHEEAELSGLHRGNRVWLDKTVPSWRAPERWQAIAFREPGGGRELFVKRLVGYPGESIQLRGGDLFINGRLAPRSLDQLRSMTVPVTDTGAPDRRSAVHATHARWSRWQPLGKTSRWSWSEHGYSITLASAPKEVVKLRSLGSFGGLLAGGEPTFGALAGWKPAPRDARHDDESVDWLEYQGRELAGQAESNQRLLDDMDFHVADSRRLHSMSDLLLTCQLRDFARGELALEATSGTDCWRTTWDLDRRQLTTTCNDRRLASYRAIGPTKLQAAKIEWAIYDQKVVLAVNGCLWSVVAQPTDTAGWSGGLTALRVGARRARVTIERLRLDRDVYYYFDKQPIEALAGWTPAGLVLAADQYFVLGDNVSRSRDSRQFGPVSRGLIVGAVRRWGSD